MLAMCVWHDELSRQAWEYAYRKYINTCKVERTISEAGLPKRTSIGQHLRKCH
jgi:hypothetical protein